MANSGPYGLPGKVQTVIELCKDTALSDAQFRVAFALVLKFHNTKTGECFPSYGQLASASGKSESTTRRTTEKLKAIGVIEFERSNGGRNHRNSYVLKRVSGADPLPDETVAPADPLETEMVSPAVPNPVTSGPLRVSPADPHISKKESKNKHEKRRRAETRIAEDAKPSQKQIEIAAKWGIAEATAREEFDGFVLWHRSHDKMHADWDATWGNWCRKHLKIAAERGTSLQNGKCLVKAGTRQFEAWWSKYKRENNAKQWDFDVAVKTGGSVEVDSPFPTRTF